MSETYGEDQVLRDNRVRFGSTVKEPQLKIICEVPHGYLYAKINTRVNETRSSASSDVISASYSSLFLCPSMQLETGSNKATVARPAGKVDALDLS